MSAVSSSLLGSSHHRNGSGSSTNKHRDSRRRERTGMAAEEANDNSNLVKLCINKPKSWNWELTTSKSSPSIAFPIIQLYDKKSGALLAETNEADCQIRGGAAGSSRGSISNSQSSSNGIIRRKNGSSASRRCATTTNLPEIIAESRDEELLSSSGQLPLKVSHCRSKSWQNDEISRGSDKCKPRSRSSSVNRKLASLDELLNGVVDQYARDGVQCKLTYHGGSSSSRRGSCERKVEGGPKLDEQRWTNNNFPLGKSKSSTYVPVVAKTTSNSSCVSTTDRKKKYRRAHSVNSLRFSNSILERIREYKRSSSTSSSEGEEVVAAEESGAEDDQPGNLLSPSGTLKRNNLRMVHSATDIAGEKSIQATEEDVYRPKYTLRTSKAGTIVVCEESFRHRKVRRRPRSLTRSEERKEGEDYVVFSPEKVKTKFEYIGRAEEQEQGEDKKGEASLAVVGGANRYQREIDNIDKMILEKLKTEKVTGGKSTLTRRHKSLVDRASVNGGGVCSKIMDSSGPIRFPSHRSVDLSTAVDGGDRRCQTVMDKKEKRISFGETTRFSRSTDYEECGGDDATRIDINDVDNLDRSRYHNDFHREVIDGVPTKATTTTTQSHHAAAGSDKDKLCPPLVIAGRKQVRRTRRSLSADYPTPRLNDLLLSSSTEEEYKSGRSDGDKSQEPQRKNRGRSRTRKRRTPTDSEEREAKAVRTATSAEDEKEGRTHKLIVKGDQVVAINNSIAAAALSKAKEQQQQRTACLIEPTDQVLLRLVRRLASMQQQQTPTTIANQHPQHDTKSINDNPDEHKQTKLLLLPQHRVNYEQNALLIGGCDDIGEVPADDKDERGRVRDKGCCNINNQEQFDFNNNNHRFEGTGEPGAEEEEDGENEVDKENMGSNVSRQSGKGLTGRRSLSSGNIFNEKSNPNQSSVAVADHEVNLTKGGGGGRSRSGGGKINKRFHGLVPDNAVGMGAGAGLEKDADTCSVSQSLMMMRMTPPPSSLASQRDRHKLCGSLPDYLDTNDDDEVDVEERTDHHHHQEGDYIVDQLQLTDSFCDVIPDRSLHNGASKVEYVTVATNGSGCSGNSRPSLTNSELVSRPPGSPYNSSSGKGSITSSSNLGSSSTFKSTTMNEVPLVNSRLLELKLPVHRVNFDPSCDQGYGSERSPEEEVAPRLPAGDPFIVDVHGVVDAVGQNNSDQYDFITKDCTFFVQITKGARGLGLSISGGVDSSATPFPGLIRIKRLFPHQAAWATGQLQPGDIILEVNGQPLTGLTNYEALEVLRTAPNNITLTVCRPEDEHYRKLSPPSEPPRPPERAGFHAPPTTLPLEPLTPIQTNFSGEFEIIMVKQQGSLGFTLRKEDESVLGHYVRALVRPPATDGIIKPGDKIVAVNDVPMSPMSHEEAVIFLRQADETVKLRLYRDVAQTPVAAMSPTNPEKGFANTLKSKQFLRPEAINLLSDLAYRKQTPPYDSSGSSVNSGTNNTIQRRLKRGVAKNQARSSTGQSDSEASTISQGSFSIQQVPNYTSSSSAEDTFTIVEDGPESADFESISDDQLYYRSEEIPDVIDDDTFNESSDSICRPNYLNLSGQGSARGSARKGKFQFSMACNGYDLNNLDNEMLDAPIYKHLPGSPSTVDPLTMSDMSDCQDFVSLPCDTFLVACKTESDLKRMTQPNHFHHSNPVYQSVQMAGAGGASAGCSTSSKDGAPSSSIMMNASISGGGGDGSAQKEGTKSLMKWKGVILSNDNDATTEQGSGGEEGSGTQATAEEHRRVHHHSSSATTDDECDGGGASRMNSQRINGSGSNRRRTEEEEEQITAVIKPNNAINFSGYKPLSLELHRGWNSRLGFSLKLNESTQRTYISAIYSDSVAARDGRLRIGDEMVRVNDESVENMSTSQIIDLLRIIRGAICLTVLRKEEEQGEQEAVVAVEPAAE